MYMKTFYNIWDIQSQVKARSLNSLKYKILLLFRFSIGRNLCRLINCLNTVCLFYTLKYGKHNQQQADITEVIYLFLFLFLNNFFSCLYGSLKTQLLNIGRSRRQIK